MIFLRRFWNFIILVCFIDTSVYSCVADIEGTGEPDAPSAEQSSVLDCLWWAWTSCPSHASSSQLSLQPCCRFPVNSHKLQTRAYKLPMASLVAQMVKSLPAVQETWVQSLGWEDLPGEGNGNPLQDSCLENPMDRGAWWTTIHGVTKSQTQLSNFTFTFDINVGAVNILVNSIGLGARLIAMCGGCHNT